MELPAEDILDAVNSSIVVTDPNAPDNPITYVNPAFEKDTGYASKDVVGHNCRFLQGPDTEETVLEGLRQALAESGKWSGVLRNYKKSGEPFWNEVSISSIREASGEITSFIGVQNDVSEKVWAEERLKELSDGTFEGIMVLAEGRIIEINQVLANMFGYEPSEVMGSSPLEFMAPEHRDHSISVMAAGSEEPYESVGVRKDGSRFEVEAQARHSTTRGNTVRTVALRDITERKKAEREREESERRLRSALLQYGSDIITILDSEGTVLYVSPSIEQSLGKKPEEHIGKSSFDLFHPEDVEWVVAQGEGVKEGSTGPPTEYRLQHADGSWRYFEGIVTNLLTDPVVGGVVVNSRDVTERKELERKLRHQALHDPLTGLPNRTLFSDRLSQSLERVSRSGETVAVMFLDLDDFKSVNDALGHSAGDELLVGVAGRLGECLRSSDTVSRMGGDEFTILLDGVDGEGETSQIAQRIVDRFHYPVTVSDGGIEREVSATVSVGVVLAAPGVDSGSTSEELLKWADTALYQSKASGKDHYLFFHPQM